MTTKTFPRLHLGPPQISGSLAIYPIFGGEPRLCYRSVAQAAKHGAFVTEVDEHGSVNDVLVCNASDQALLLYEGELIIGARQNRTIDQPVLVPAGVELKVPVSCVEQGRWDHRQRAKRFRPSRHTVDPALRRSKRAVANARSAAAGQARPDQGDVWREVQARLDIHAVASPSVALNEVFAAKRPALDELTKPLHVVAGQIGAIAAIAGKPVALDLVSRPDVFADLLPRLADGYALQALEPSYAGRPLRIGTSNRAAEEFLELVLSSRRRWSPTPGMGEAFVPTRRGIDGCGLHAGWELVALSAFPSSRRPD